MKAALWMPPFCATLLVLNSCATKSDPLATTGPFDSNGNYIEEWADNPSKWRTSGGTPSPHDIQSDELPEIVATNEQPPANSVPLISSSSSTQTVVARKAPVKRSEPVMVKAKPKPKPVVKAKPKPKVQRYVVRKGDSLSRIASRNGTSVSALRRANSISGSLIRPGQSLVIPR